MIIRTRSTPATGEQNPEDEALAAFTDALLANQCPGAEERRPAFADTVEILARTLGPQTPPERLRLRIRRSILAEWPQPGPSLSRQVLRFFKRPARRWAWAAVAALFVLVLAIALILPGPVMVTGTAAGGTGVIVLAILFIVAVVLAVVWFTHQR